VQICLCHINVAIDLPGLPQIPEPLTDQSCAATSSANTPIGVGRPHAAPWCANLHSARRSRRHRLPFPAGSFIEGFRTPATVQAAPLRSAGIRNPQQHQTLLSPTVDVRKVPTSDFGIRGRCATLDDVETLCGREYRWHSTVSAGALGLSKRQAKRSSLALMLAILSAAPWKVAGRCLPIGLHRFFRSVAVGAVVSQSQRCSDHCLTWPGTPAIGASTDVASHTFPTCYCHREP